MLALLGARTVAFGGWRLPDCLESVCRPPAPLDTEDAVEAMRDAGKLTGLVGDLGLGLTKPVSCSRDGLTGAGFLPLVEPGGFDADLELVVVPGSPLAGSLSCVLTRGLGSRRLTVPDEVFEVGPDFEGPLAAVFAEAADGRVIELFLAGTLFSSLILLSIFVLPPVTGSLCANLEPLIGSLSVGSDRAKEGPGCSSSTFFSGLWLGLSGTVPSVSPDVVVIDGSVAAEGDLEIPSFANSLRGVLPTSSREEFSGSMSVLGHLLEGLDS